MRPIPARRARLARRVFFGVVFSLTADGGEGNNLFRGDFQCGNIGMAFAGQVIYRHVGSGKSSGFRRLGFHFHNRCSLERDTDFILDKHSYFLSNIPELNRNKCHPPKNKCYPPKSRCQMESRRGALFSIDFSRAISESFAATSSVLCAFS